MRTPYIGGSDLPVIHLVTVAQVAENTSITEHLPEGPWREDMRCPIAVIPDVWSAPSRLHVVAAVEGWQTPPQRFTLLRLRRHAAAHHVCGFSLFYGTVWRRPYDLDRTE